MQEKKSTLKTVLEIIQYDAKVPQVSNILGDVKQVLETENKDVYLLFENDMSNYKLVNIQDDKIVLSTYKSISKVFTSIEEVIEYNLERIFDEDTVIKLYDIKIIDNSSAMREIFNRDMLFVNLLKVKPKDPISEKREKDIESVNNNLRELAELTNKAFNEFREEINNSNNVEQVNPRILKNYTVQEVAEIICKTEDNDFEEIFELNGFVYTTNHTRTKGYIAYVDIDMFVQLAESDEYTIELKDYDMSNVKVYKFEHLDNHSSYTIENFIKEDPNKKYKDFLHKIGIENPTKNQLNLIKELME